jgi:acyl-CoA dehydrogenase family protein 9
MLKVFSTEALWQMVNDTMQIYGGQAYFSNEPYERMMRDARINMIGEGANDVLRAFVALVGMRDVGLELKGILDALANPFKHFSKLGGFAGRKLEGLFNSPEVNVRSAELLPDAQRLGALVAKFGSNVERLLRTHREAIVDRQFQQGRIADAAIELYVSACVLCRLDAMLEHALPRGEGRGEGANTDSDFHQYAGTNHHPIDHNLTIGCYYLHSAERRIRRALADLWDNDDERTSDVADQLFSRRH